jgi:hypothetical protein
MPSAILSASPGQTVTIVFDLLQDGYFIDDGYGIPQVYRIIFPNLTVAAGYPQSMNRIDVGLYNYSFLLPTGASAVGSYIVDIRFLDPTTGNPQSRIFQIICSAPFGNYTASTF